MERAKQVGNEMKPSSSSSGVCKELDPIDLGDYCRPEVGKVAVGHSERDDNVLRFNAYVDVALRTQIRVAIVASAFGSSNLFSHDCESQ